MEPVGATFDWHSCASRPQGSEEKKKKNRGNIFKTKNGKVKLVEPSEVKLSQVAPVNIYFKTWH